MVSPDTKYTNKSNFFACLPDIKSWSLEARDALRASVELSMQEVKKRGIRTIAFSSCVTDFPSKEYAKILVETIKTLLDGEKQSTKLETMMFCAKDASHTSSFVQTLKQTFGCKNVHVSGSIRETKTVLNASNLTNETGNYHKTSKYGDKQISANSANPDSQFLSHFHLLYALLLFIMNLL